MGLCLAGRRWRRILLYSLVTAAVLYQVVVVLMYGAASCSSQESQRLLKMLVSLNTSHLRYLISSSIILVNPVQTLR